MKTKILGLVLAFCFLAASASFAADAFSGTWKLNTAKSKIAKNAPKNDTVIYKDAGKGWVKISVHGTDADGKAHKDEWKGQFDGKSYKVKGDSASDARAYTKVSDNTLDFKVINDGKITGNGRVVISKDGKSRTVTMEGTGADGKKFKSKAVYDKQG